MLGQRIKELRKNAKMTQQALAEGVITRSYLSQIEKGVVQPSYEVLQRLAEKLSCPVDSLYESPENKDLLILQMKKDIKAAENYVLGGNFKKANNLLAKHQIHEGLNAYDKGISCWVEGMCQISQREYEKALNVLKESIQYFMEHPNTEEMVRSMDSLGYVNLQLNQNEQALEILNKAYRKVIHEQIGGLIRISLLINLGIAHGKLKEYYSAINFLTEAQELNRSMDTHYKAGQILMALGVCNMQLKRWQDAQKSYKQSLQFFRLKKDVENEAGTYTNLGILYTHQKKYQQSVHSLHQAIDLYEKAGVNEYQLLNARAELAKTFFLQNKMDEAYQTCQQILVQKTHRVHRGRAYEILGDIGRKNGQLSAAIDAYQKAGESYPEQSPQSQAVNRKIAEVFSEQGDYRKAVKHYQMTQPGEHSEMSIEKA